MLILRHLLFLLVLITLAPVAWAQSSRLPPEISPKPLPVPLDSYEVEGLDLSIELQGQMAQIVWRQTILNTGPQPLEMDYLAPLPPGSDIQGLILLADGQELVGKVYDKAEAFEIYRRIVTQTRDPALMEYSGRGLYRARIFPIPVKGKRTLEMKLQYLLPKDGDQITLSVPVAGPLTKGKTIADQKIQVTIAKTPNLASVYSPLSEVVVDRGPDRTTATYSAKASPALDNFLLYLKVDKTPLGGLILSNQPYPNEDGFFLFLAEPTISALEKPTATQASKNVIFVLDTSGSMIGVKFEQAVAALEFILTRLNPVDTFNLVDFSSTVVSWKTIPQAMSSDNRRAALKYLHNLRAQGGTNIEKAIEMSLAMVNPEVPSYIILLTDGEATSGVTDEMLLTQLAQKHNPCQARIFSFGVGEGVNARLLDRLSGNSGGTTTYVNAKENLEEKVGSFFSKLTSPVLTKPTLTVDLQTNRLIPQKTPDIFQNSQIVVVGRYPKAGRATFKLSGQVDGHNADFTYLTSLADGPQPGGDFIQQLWAQRRIGEIIDYIDLNGQDKTKNNHELIDELVYLSKKYGIMTPYTSFLALEKTNLADQTANTRVAAQNLRIIEETVGASANAQRAVKQDFMAAERKPTAASASPKFEAMASMDAEVAASPSSQLEPPRQLGGKTFFLKNGQWEDADLTEKDQKNVQEVEQFSENYFRLAEELSPEQKVWLSQSQPVLLNFAQKNYLIKPAGPVKPASSK
jgi:Ca-activated chloride channel family protein